MSIESKVTEILNEDKNRRKSKENDSYFQDIVDYLNNCRDKIISFFGENGRFWFDYTMVRLGLYNYPLGKAEKINKITRELLNFNVYKNENVALPFIKEEEDKIEVGNLILNEVGFTKIDYKDHTVEGYANVTIADLADDLIFPSAYKDSASKLTKTYFMHHKDLPDGEIVESRFDEFGWYVKSRLEDWAWAKVADGTIKGYSIGGSFVMFPKFVGGVAVFKEAGSVVIDDLSHVTSPCNKLSFFKSESQKTDSTVVKGGEEIPVTDLNKKESETFLTEEKINKFESETLERFKKLETTFEEAIKQINEKLDAFGKNIEAVSTKIAKIEAVPESKPTLQKIDVSPIEVARSSMNFSDFCERMKQLNEVH
ncbi:MAG: hypothetical protein NWE98_02050 [Candidatus Bathyarchaeota archaeon]|nr:hypothetical protein [Candidatus Bathyarchaeota archaeon]